MCTQKMTFAITHICIDASQYYYCCYFSIGKGQCIRYTHSILRSGERKEESTCFLSFIFSFFYCAMRVERIHCLLLNWNGSCSIIEKHQYKHKLLQMSFWVCFKQYFVNTFTRFFFLCVAESFLNISIICIPFSNVYDSY